LLGFELPQGERAQCHLFRPCYNLVTMDPKKDVSRRDFLRWSTRLAGGLIGMPFLEACQRLGLVAPAQPQGEPSPVPMHTLESTRTATPVVTLPPQVSPTVAAGVARVAFVRARDRAQGVKRALSLLGDMPIAGKRVLLKPNFNSPDPAPASTHPETLRALVESLQEMNAATITVADRSGMGVTRHVMERLGVFDLAAAMGIEALIFDELVDEKDWTLVRTEGDHWEGGFPVPRRLLETDAVVQTCCLKPHRFGGQFTLSLKNSVGLVGKHLGSGGYNYMSELHNSPYQRLMIAEVNAVYNPALVVLDGVEAFIDNGPERGTKVWGDVILAGSDRVAVDAAGLALLRHLGYRGAAAEGPIFAQEQIARAAELGLGVDGVEKIEFVTDDPESAAYAAQIRALMAQSG
jgi:uncharacterized protein (DUF362 family)